MVAAPKFVPQPIRSGPFRGHVNLSALPVEHRAPAWANLQRNAPDVAEILSKQVPLYKALFGTVIVCVDPAEVLSNDCQRT